MDVGSRGDLVVPEENGKQMTATLQKSDQLCFRMHHCRSEFYTAIAIKSWQWSDRAQ
ncbi:hypothetical protein [Pantanalinema sp. GBBB05]|uniref:hypothetical protein n=1 Tax=Pantanalinema sp. GBBB05 TaxID=2604139 RepID=UPI003D81AEAD